MSSERLAALLGDVDEKYILETMPKKRSETHKYIMIAAAAASFIIAASSLYFFRFESGSSDMNSDSELAEIQSTSVRNETEMPVVISEVSDTDKNETSAQISYASSTFTEIKTDAVSENDNTYKPHTVPVTEVPVMSVITEKTDVLSTSEERITTEAFQSTVSETAAEQTEITSVSEILPFPQIRTETESSTDIVVPDAFDISKAEFMYADYDGRKYDYSGDHSIPDTDIGNPAFVKYIILVGKYETDLFYDSYTGNGIFSYNVLFLDLTHDGNYKVFINNDLSDEEKDLIIKQITDS